MALCDRDEDEPLKREEIKSCSMCRAALHKLCAKKEQPKGECYCDCERGY